MKNKAQLETPELKKRFDEDEIALRRKSFDEGALGRHDSDYHNMYNIFLRLVRRVEAIDEDPHAFMTTTGGYDTKVIDSTTKLFDTARKTLESLNKMRNEDRQLLFLLETHTRDMAQRIASPLGAELREILEDAQGIPQASHLAARIRRLIGDGVRTMFAQAAMESMARSRDEYKLH